ncbi:MAG: phosphoribosylformylglycinamidine synthase subunit PurL [Candidatus Aureabacteria bacterium]|nr:phosphoribosylformylglycinamidine synthase subunit PurL [Candidatus Auribacterota bacterium]
MNHRIEIKRKPAFKDGRENKVLDVIREDTGIKPLSVRLIQVYHLFGEYTGHDLNRLILELFCDPVCQEASASFHFARNMDHDFVIEVAYLPGVTDNVGRTAAKGIGHILGREIKDSHVRSAWLYLFKGLRSKKEAEHIAKKVLCNTLIEQYSILSKNEVDSGKIISYSLPREAHIKPPYFFEMDLQRTDQGLKALSDQYVLSLSLEEMHAIRNHYRKSSVRKDRKTHNLPENPTDMELEILAQTWSEHCKHKIFAASIDYREGRKRKKIDSLFKTYIKGSTEKIKKTRKDLLSVFVDNSGIVRFNEEYAYCVKVETHNSPSALDPYGGAMTGIVGVNRDILGTGMGAYPIFNTDIFCFGSPFTSEKALPEGLLHPRRIFRGVHRGIKDGGNESGIPTVNGSIIFDPSFLGKPLVFCGTGGLIPVTINGRLSCRKYTRPGDIVVMCGGRIGKDGIHGATFSSAHLTETSPTSAVQIGDPITQKKMLDFLMEARDQGLYSGITDNGAGGLSSSVGEMAQATDGAVLYLEKCPLKYDGLRPWEILLSEAQERMSLAVPKDKLEAFLTLSKKRDVESTPIGEFSDTGYFECYYKGTLVCRLEMKMLHEGVPKMELEAVFETAREERLKIQSTDYGQNLLYLLSRPNVASKESWVRMYDHEVQARTVLKPFCGKDNDGPSDGAVLKMFPDSCEGLVITHGLVPRYSKIDTYQMAANAVDEAVRSAVGLGANPLKLTGLDNFCWPDPVQSKHTPDGKQKLGQLVRACQAVHDVTIAYQCPCISGKDSMKNDYRGKRGKISVLPTLLFTVAGKIDDIRKAVSFYFKRPGSAIYLLGQTHPELGASEYYDMQEIKGGCVPKVHPEKARILYRKIHQAIGERLLESVHDLSDGGLAVALAEAAFSGNLGAIVQLETMGNTLTSEEKLFSESPSRLLVSVSPDNEREFKRIFKGESCCYLGKTVLGTDIIFRDKDAILIHEDRNILKSTWKEALNF